MTPPPRSSLRYGRWQDATPPPKGDVLLTDPPYSARTHSGFRSGSEGVAARIERYGSRQPGCRNRLGYAPLSREEAGDLVQLAIAAEVRWFVAFGDHQSFLVWEELLGEAGWLTFAPVLWVKSDAPPRMAGDGPQSAFEYLAVARPRRRVRYPGSRRGFYMVQTEKSPLPPSERIVGMKRPADLAQLVLDYTVPGDLVLDPYAGTASMGVACVSTGRGYLGYEKERRTYDLGVRKLGGVSLPIPGTEPNRWATDSPAAQIPLTKE